MGISHDKSEELRQPNGAAFRAAIRCGTDRAISAFFNQITFLVGRVRHKREFPWTDNPSLVGRLSLLLDLTQTK